MHYWFFLIQYKTVRFWLFRDQMVVFVRLFWVLWKVSWSMLGRTWALLSEIVFIVFSRIWFIMMMTKFECMLQTYWVSWRRFVGWWKELHLHTICILVFLIFISYLNDHILLLHFVQICILFSTGLCWYVDIDTRLCCYHHCYMLDLSWLVLFYYWILPMLCLSNCLLMITAVPWRCSADWVDSGTCKSS